MRDRIFYSICFGFLIGVLLRSFVFVNILLTILFSLIAFGLFLFFTLIEKNHWGIIVSIFVLAFCFGIFRFSSVDIGAPKILESQVGQAQTFKGEIVEEPDVRQTNQLLTVQISSQKINTKVLISTDLTQGFKYGENEGRIMKMMKCFVTDNVE